MSRTPTPRTGGWHRQQAEAAIGPLNYEAGLNQQSCLHTDELEAQGVRFDDVRTEDR